MCVCGGGVFGASLPQDEHGMYIIGDDSNGKSNLIISEKYYPSQSKCHKLQSC